MTFPIRHIPDNDITGRTQTSVSISSLSVSLTYVVLHCTMSIHVFVPCLVGVSDSCGNVKALPCFRVLAEWRDHYRADKNNRQEFQSLFFFYF